jgi:hypothetical protein
MLNRNWKNMNNLWREEPELKWKKADIVNPRKLH